MGRSTDAAWYTRRPMTHADHKAVGLQCRAISNMRALEIPHYCAVLSCARNLARGRRRGDLSRARPAYNILYVDCFRHINAACDSQTSLIAETLARLPQR